MQFYKSLDYVKSVIEESGGKIEQINKLNDLLKLPFPLNTGKVLKYSVLIVGKKI